MVISFELPRSTIKLQNTTLTDCSLKLVSAFCELKVEIMRSIGMLVNLVGDRDKRLCPYLVRVAQVNVSETFH